MRAGNFGDKLKGITGITRHAKATGRAPLLENETIAVPHVVALGGPRRRQVREMAERGART